MTEKIPVRLDEREYAALVRLSARELRSVDGQARVIIREHLRSAGLLPNDQQASEAEGQGVAEYAEA